MKLPKYKYILAIIDFFSAFFILIISYSYVVSNYNKFFTIFSSDKIIISVLFFLLSILFVFFQQSNNLYKLNISLSKSIQTVYILKSLLSFTVILIVFSFLFKIVDILFSRIFVVIVTLGVFTAVFIFRVFFFQIIYKIFTENKIIIKNILIIGAGKSGKIVAKKLSLSNGLGIKILGFIDDKKENGLEIIEGIDVIGSVEDIKSLKESFNFSEVIIAIDHITYERLIEIIESCKRLDLIVKISSDLFDIIPKKIEIEKYNDVALVNASPQIHSDVSIFFKRIIDILGAVLGIIILSPLLIIVVFLILLTSKGPIIFKQTRIGKNGKPFPFYKFRSMRIVESKVEKKRVVEMIEFMKNGNPKKGSTKVVDENRITSIGKFIRKTSIDELPQLINVIRGEMSLVGPRPCLPYEYDNLEQWQKRRFDVLPGCTGVWQVLGRSEVSFKDSVVLDLYYINNMSPWLDLQLILKTIPVMIFSKGGK